ncbi:carrier superfamily protein [Besnoitia besnoiti]|uniref:Carrier superfamily protein n=1 Tax=Besnoitia besnoiti TaxID=94643 RepID=A0A2A9MFB6_BESBE|nr:carrier superfamily protein [Besnoitia besnoiti]PFH34951.1 carrier superfamily protein [Besnoitia besnoiti]
MADPPRGVSKALAREGEDERAHLHSPVSPRSVSPFVSSRYRPPIRRETSEERAPPRGVHSPASFPQSSRAAKDFPMERGVRSLPLPFSSASSSPPPPALSPAPLLRPPSPAGASPRRRFARALSGFPSHVLPWFPFSVFTAPGQHRPAPRSLAGSRATTAAMADAAARAVQPAQDEAVDKPKDVLYVFQRGEFLQALLHTLAGVSGASLAMILVYPLDFLRTEQSVKGIGCGTLRDEAMQIIKKKGWRGMYRGLRSALYGVVVSWGVYFFVYSYAKAYLQKRGFKPSGLSNMLLAIVAGLCSTVASNPLWVANTRIKLDPPGRTTDIWRMLARILKREGFRGWFAGLLPALVLVANPAIQFVLYDFLKESLTALKNMQAKLRAAEASRATRSPNPAVTSPFQSSSFSSPLAAMSSAAALRFPAAHPRGLGCAASADEAQLNAAGVRLCSTASSASVSSSLPGGETVEITVAGRASKAKKTKAGKHAVTGGEAFLIGMVAKLCATLATYPYLVVKTRAQTKLHNVHDNSASFRCLVTILETEGVSGLFAGLKPKLLATLLSSAVMFSVYEKLLPHAEQSLKSLSFSPHSAFAKTFFPPPAGSDLRVINVSPDRLVRVSQSVTPGEQTSGR